MRRARVESQPHAALHVDNTSSSVQMLADLDEEDAHDGGHPGVIRRADVGDEVRRAAHFRRPSESCRVVVRMFARTRLFARRSRRATAILGRHSGARRRRSPTRRSASVARRREGQRLPARRRPHLDVGFERDAGMPERRRHHPYDLVYVLVDSGVRPTIYGIGQILDARPSLMTATVAMPGILVRVEKVRLDCAALARGCRSSSAGEERFDAFRTLRSRSDRAGAGPLMLAIDSNDAGAPSHRAPAATARCRSIERLVVGRDAHRRGGFGKGSGFSSTPSTTE